MTVATATADFGARLRSWRNQRRLSQLELAGRAEVSSRHLSFLETGRARPSREMVVHLAEELDVPLRQRNDLLMSAGFSPAYGEHGLDDADMASVRQALTAVLDAHEPYPAVVVDSAWDLVDANAGAQFFLGLVDPRLLEPTINVVRLSLHPDGLAPRIVNFDEFAAHAVARLRRQVERSSDPGLAELLDEVSAYPAVVAAEQARGRQASDAWVVLPMRVDVGEVELAFFSTISVFGAPLDVTLDELAVEAFYPADEATADWLRARA